ncbi:ATP-dependent RNA helicase [Sorochytrium milnesiophthora]
MSSALFDAITREDLGFLESRRASVDLAARNESGKTLVHAACEVQNAAILNFLAGAAEKPAVLNAVDKEHQTPIYICAAIGWAAGLSILLQHGAQPDIGNAEDTSPLMIACYTGQLECARILLDDGKVDLNHRDKASKSPLSLAAFEGLVDIVVLLTTRGVRLNDTDQYGWTPMMLACHAGHYGVVAALLRSGADPSVATKDGKTCLSIAQSRRNQKIIDLLVKHSTNPARAATMPTRPDHQQRAMNIPAAQRSMSAPRPGEALQQQQQQMGRFDVARMPSALSLHNSGSREYVTDQGIPLLALNNSSSSLPQQQSLPKYVPQHHMMDVEYEQPARPRTLKRGNTRTGKHAAEINAAVPQYKAHLGERRGPGDTVVHKGEESLLWVYFARIVTFWAPGILLSKLAGLHAPIVQQAWREKIALCFIILLISGMVAFVTFGFSSLVCSPIIPLYYFEWQRDFARTPKGSNPSLALVRGSLYDIGSMVKFGYHRQFVNDGHTNITGAADLQQLDSSLSNYYGADTPAFDFCQNLPDQFSHCHTSAKSVAQLNAFKYKQFGSLMWSWQNITQLQNKLFVYNNRVYSLIDYLKPENTDRYLSNQPLGLSNSDLQNLVGKDITMAVNKNSTLQKLIPCLNTYYAYGVLEGTAPGCVASNLVQGLAAVVLGGLIIIKFGSAVTFDWFQSRRIGKLQAQHPQSFVICLVTCYSEDENGLRTTLDSLSATDYNDRQKLLFVIADGNITGAGQKRSTPESLKAMIEMADGMPAHAEPYSYMSIGDGYKRHNMAEVYAGHYVYKDKRVPFVFVNKVGTPQERAYPKAGNRGKRDSQLILMQWLSKVTFNERMTPLEFDLSDKVARLTNMSPEMYDLVLMVDADTLVLPDSLRRMVTTFERDEAIMGLCGETRIANKSQSWVTMIQVYEYYISHHLGKAFESIFGGVTCLPGCFCAYRIKVPKSDGYCVPILANPDIVENYSQNNVETLHEKNLLLLGEDRYLTTLMLRTFPKRKMVYVPRAICKTEVPDKFSVLLSQRRRWINSTIHNLLELVLVRDLCGIFCFSMQFVVALELLGTVVLPSMVFFLIYLIAEAAKGNNNALLPIYLILSVFGLQAVLILTTTRKPMYVIWMLVYILAIPVWNLILPAYAFWHFDDFSWGKTRKIVGVDNGHGDDGESTAVFDPSKIPMKRFADWQREKRFRLQQMQAAQQQTQYYSPSLGPAPGYTTNSPRMAPAGYVLTPRLELEMATAAAAHQFDAARLQRTLDARDANLRAVQSPVVPSGALDSNIKKNTTFIRKLSKITPDTLPSIESDLPKLKVDKYIAEMVSSILDNFVAGRKYATADIDAVATVVSLLHRRFTHAFTPLFVEQVRRVLGASPAPPSKTVLQTDQRDKDEKERIGRTRGLIRLWCEMYLLGLLVPMRTVSGRGADDSISSVVGGATISPVRSGGKQQDVETAMANTFMDVVREALVLDKQHSNMQNAVVLAKFYGAILASPGDAKQDQQQGEEAAARQPLKWPVAETVREATRALLVGYFDSMTARLVKEHKLRQELEHKNKEWYFQKGAEPPEEFKARHERVTHSCELHKTNGEILADLLGLTMPKLQEDDGATRIDSLVITGTNAEGSEREVDVGIWEDEDQKVFYEGVVDLQELVPPFLLQSDYKAKKREPADGGKAGEASDTPEQAGAAAEVQPADEAGEATEPSDEPESTAAAAAADKEDEDATKPEAEATDAKGSEEMDGVTRNAHFVTFLARLPTLSNRDLIDRAAVEFTGYNTKATRKRLITTLLDLPKGRHDLIPYYARLIATLGRYFPDISDTIVDSLESKFRGVVRRVQSSRGLHDVMDFKLATVKYLGELAKFRVVPSHVIFFAFKMLLESFSPQSIELTCCFLETCGRFLYKSADTKVRMANMLETLQRKAKATVTVMDRRLQLMLENAYFTCVPTERVTKPPKERSEAEQFVRWLLFTDLSDKSMDHLVELLRRLPWSEDYVQRFMHSIFTKIWKVKYSNVKLMAAFVGSLARHQPAFANNVLDFVLEDVRLGMEQNLFKHNQRRVTMVLYLGELYNFRVASAAVVFDTLYSLLTFGHANGIPTPEGNPLLDANTDYFRIRLVCTLLDTCCTFLDRGANRRKIDAFLALFQLYIQAKAPPPMDVEFVIQDLFELVRPKLKLCESYEEAVQGVQEMMTRAQVAPVDNEDDEGQAAANGSVDMDDDRESSGSGDEDEDGTTPSHDGDTLEVDPEDDVVVVHIDEKQASKEEDDEFDRELNQMMTESLEGRRFERSKNTVLDVPLPMRHRTQAPEQVDEKHITFTLMTRKGNKGQAKHVALPVESAVVQSVISKQEEQRAEKEQLKRLVLKYERSEEESELRSLQEREGGVAGTAGSSPGQRDRRGRRVLIISGGRSGGRGGGSGMLYGASSARGAGGGGGGGPRPARRGGYTP